MAVSKFIHALFFIFISQSLFAQWQKLPDIVSPYRAFPVADGKLFAGTDYIPNPPSSSTPPYTSFGHSNNDLNSFIFNFYLSITFAAASVESGQSANDSTVCFNYGGDLIFTFNGFKTKNSVSSVLNIPAVSFFGSNCITSKFMYHTEYVNYPVIYSDTLFFIRENAASLKMVTKITQYTSPVKLRFVNDSVGFFLVNNKNNPARKCLIKTINYGQSWSEIMMDPINQVEDFSFLSASTGYLIKTNGSIYKTVNGGTSWNQVGTPSASLNCIQFANDTLGYIGANGGLLWKTIDGGANWQSEVSNTTANISTLYTFGNVAYFATSSNKIFKNGSPSVGMNELSQNVLGAIVFPNPVEDQLIVDLSGVGKEMVEAIQIINTMGIIVYEKKVVDQGLKIQVSVKELPVGTYFVITKTQNHLLRNKITVIK